MEIIRYIKILIQKRLINIGLIHEMRTSQIRLNFCIEVIFLNSKG